MKDRIIELANELTRELINSGYDLKGKAIYGTIPGYLNFDINIFDHGTEKNITVENINRGWAVTGTYTGAWFESEESKHE